MEEAGFLKLVELIAGHYNAFLFDSDGTLADNRSAHTATYIFAAKGAGMPWIRIDQLTFG